MTEAKTRGKAMYTKGEWTVGKFVRSGGGLVYIPINGTGGKYLASASVYVHDAKGDCKGKTVSEEECEANARLIAAAPDLYEALKALAEWKLGLYSLVGRPSLPTGRTGREIIEQVDKAVAKAEGKA